VSYQDMEECLRAALDLLHKANACDYSQRCPNDPNLAWLSAHVATDITELVEDASDLLARVIALNSELTEQP